MNVWEAIRLQSLKTVMRPDEDYHLRSVMRWYSREFHTPLDQVYGIPVEEVLRDYFECKYEEMEEYQLEELREYLTCSDEERARMEEEAMDEEADAAKFYEEALKEAELEDTEAPPPPIPTAAPGMSAASFVPDPILPLPEISMKFDETNNLSEEDFEARFNPINAIRKR